MRAKVFVEKDAEALESALVQWLDVNDHHEVIHVLQSESSDGKKKSITVTIFYR